MSYKELYNKTLVDLNKAKFDLQQMREAAMEDKRTIAHLENELEGWINQYGEAQREREKLRAQCANYSNEMASCMESIEDTNAQLASLHDDNSRLADKADALQCAQRIAVAIGEEAERSNASLRFIEVLALAIGSL